MSDNYPKASGSAGSKGVDFQVDLLSVFLLNALKNFKDWRLSTENKLAGKFDDVVLELSDGSAILLQAKHKEKKKITLDQLVSTNPKNEDFSLPKYFLSYLNDVKTKFPVKLVIVCTNTEADADILKFLNRESICRDSMLYHEDGASFFTLNDDIVPDLIANAKVYNKLNLRGKSIDESTITEESVTEFLRHLQIHSNYPSGTGLEKVIEKLLSSLKCSGNLLRNVSHRDIHQKVKDWFEQPKGEYLTECRAKVMLCEIKSEKYRLLLEDYKVFFKNNDSSFTDSEKRIFHIVAEGGCLLHLMKVYRSLQHIETKILYAGSEDGLDVQEQVIRIFEAPQYTYLIIVSPKFSDKFAINEICTTLGNILHKREYKKVILVAESHNKLTQRLKVTGIDYDTFHHSPTLEDLSEDTQQMLLRKKNIAFQGEDFSLAEIFSEHVTVDHKESIKSDILQKLVKDETIKIGMKLTNLEEDILGYYIDRRFERIPKVEDEFMEEDTLSEEDIYNVDERIPKVEDEFMEEEVDTLSEEDIYKVDEKIVLISDSAGAGKTTVLKNLAVTIKNNNPCLWVIRIELNDCTKILRDSLKNGKPIDVQKLLSCRESTRLTNDLEKIVFSLKERVVLMLDGVDEISPDYTSLIKDMLLQSQKAENLRKVFVTTRTHMEKDLEATLNVRSFTLVPLTKRNQIDFLVYYWTHALDLEDEGKSRCERYATMLIHRVSSWTKNFFDDDKFSSSPLHGRMLAEVFLENNGDGDWEGCKEYLSVDEVEPRLPVKMDIAKLYEMFIDKKKDIFMDKGNPSGNVTANQALMDQFEECLAYHRSLALEAVLDEEACNFFFCYQRNVKYEQIKVLKMGIVQELDNELRFVHRTFAEYFVAECLLKELQLGNSDIKFQKFLIDEVCLHSEFDITRRFLDNFLQKHAQSLSFDIFESYMSIVDDTNNPTLIHRLAKKGNTEIISFILKCIDFKVVIGRETTIHYGKYISVKRNTLSILKYLLELGGINITDYKDRTPLHLAAQGGHLDTVKFLVELGANVSSIDMSEGTALHYAASWGDIDMVEFLVKHIVDINIRNSKNCTALHYAAKKNRFDVAEFLVKHGADINMADRGGSTTLHDAAKSGSFDIVKFLVKCNVDINVGDENGRTALHFASVRGSLDVFEFLVEHNANIEITDKEGYTVLHFAAWRGSFSMVKLLAKYGIPVDVECKKRYTPLHFAAWRGSPEIVEFLIQHGADINKRGVEGYTALHCATQKDSFDSIQNMLKNYGPDIDICYDNEDMDLSVPETPDLDFDDDDECLVHNDEDINTFNTVEFLLKNDVDVNAQTKNGYTALHFAANEGSSNIVKLLVEHDANVNITNKEGYTALHFATRYGCFHIVEFLVKNGANIHTVNRKGNTALHYAAESGNFEIVEYLIKHEVDIHITNNKGYTALHIAAKNSNFDIVEYLIKQGVDIRIADKDGYTALHYAAHTFNLKIVEVLVSHGANVNTTTTKKGYTVLHLAAKNGTFETVEFLVRHHADIHVTNNEGCTALHFAAKSGNFETVELLVKHGADIHGTDKEGFTPLHLAAKSSSFDIVEFLVENDAKVNVRTKEGCTVLHFAAKHGCFRISEFLVKNGADIHIANNKGNTALHYAAKSDNLDIVEHLVKHEVDIHITNKKGYTALHFAAKHNSLDIVDFLVKHEVDIHIAGKDGYTALHYAVQTDSFAVVEYLVSHGANVNTATKEGNTALHLAAKSASLKIAEFLMRHDANIDSANNKGCTPLHFAAMNDRFKSFKLVELLVGHGVDIHIADKKGFTGLHFAADSGSFNIVELLVKHNANVNVRTKKGYTALHFAAKRGLDISEFLVTHGADINIANCEGYTALHFAAKNRKIVEFFARHVVDVNVASKEGDTALHLAAEKGNFHVINVLVKHGVDTNVANKDGNTALHFAVKNGFLDAVELLVNHGADINVANKKGKTALQLAIDKDKSDTVKFLEGVLCRNS